MTIESTFAELKASGVTAEGARRFADGSSENLDPDVLSKLTEANLTEAQLHHYADWVES